MTDHDGLKRVFTGSSVDANFIKSILEDNGVGCIVKDSLQESTIAGWGSGAPEVSCRVFVVESDEESALDLVKQYLESINNI